MTINLNNAGFSLSQLQQMHTDTAVERLGIRITVLGRNYLCGEMPVDERTVQPFGVLHGGSSVLLAETLGGVASTLHVAAEGGTVVGTEVSGSHVRAVRSGKVIGTCRPLRLGRGMHFWHIAIRDESGRLCCDAKLTTRVLRKRS